MREEFIVQEDDIELNGTAPTAAKNDTEVLCASGSAVVTDAGAGEPSLAKQGETANGHHALMTLARLLFSACDICIYCGGKFVG